MTPNLDLGWKTSVAEVKQIRYILFLEFLPESSPASVSLARSEQATHTSSTELSEHHSPKLALSISPRTIKSNGIG